MEQKIKTIINQTNIGDLRSYTWLGNGFVSNAYQIETSSGTYVLLEAKEKTTENTDYKTYYGVLRCLEKRNYPHAPKAVYLSEDASTLVITKLEGKALPTLKHLTKEERQTIALNITDALMELGEIQPDNLSQELQQVGAPTLEPYTMEKDWDTYVLQRFYPYKDTAPEDAPTLWLEDQIKNHTPSAITDKPELLFVHGDTSAPNVLITKNFEVNLLDWGEAKFYICAKDKIDFGLAYAMNNIDIMNEFRAKVLQRVAQKLNVSYEDFSSYVFEKQKHVKIADITWAYMMYVRATKGEVSSDPPETFKSILDKRIHEYTTTFL